MKKEAETKYFRIGLPRSVIFVAVPCLENKNRRLFAFTTEIWVCYPGGEILTSTAAAPFGTSPTRALQSQ